MKSQTIIFASLSFSAVALLIIIIIILVTGKQNPPPGQLVFVSEVVMIGSTVPSQNFGLYVDPPT